MIEIVLSPPIAFLVFLALFYLVYWLGSTMAPKMKKNKGELSMYACGEDIPAGKLQFGYRLFFFIALFFTMMHVAVLVLATIPKGAIVYFGVFYLGMILLSVFALVTRE